MSWMRKPLIVLALACLPALAGLPALPALRAEPVVKGPENGALVIVGGGKVGDDILRGCSRSAAARTRRSW